MSREDSGPSLGDVVSAAALVLGLIAAWLYVTGWTYAVTLRRGPRRRALTWATREAWHWAHGDR
jgi:hypothetical protein